MARHLWPGNVRELRNFIERVLIMTVEEEVTEDMAAQLLGLSESGRKNTAAACGQEVDAYSGLSFKEAKRCFEQDFLRTRLTANDGNISRTAEQLGMERSNLHKKLKQAGGRGI